MYRVWKLHEYRTRDVFGMPWIDLPIWLHDDLLNLLAMEAWHRFNKELPSLDGVPNIDDIMA